ncbi:MAG: PQQ-binding-like beta-propeller repeat protein, partial [Thiohalobacterales bacterium]|nr:PQQ-binding-like beta-propeller repeat protein [Thiohalobacterales bacterium]
MIRRHSALRPFSLLAAFCLVFAGFPVHADHDLILGIDEGFEVCDITFNVIGATSGGCNVVEGNNAFDQAGGSYMWVDLNGDGNFGDAGDSNEIKALYAGPDGGIWVDHEQLAGGSHAGLPDAFGGTSGIEDPHIDSPFYYLGNTAMHYTDVSTGLGGITTYGVPPVFLTNDGNSATMDFTSWRATWWGGTPTYHDLSGQSSGGSGIATVDCTPKPCASGSTYVLDYSAVLPAGDPFAGLQWSIHLEGIISGDAATILTEPQDVRAAIEWIPSYLANTSSLDFTPMQIDLTGDVAVTDKMRIDLPAKGNRRMVSGDSTGTGASFIDPRTAIIDEANNRAIVSDQGLPGLVAVDLATGNRTVFSQDGVAGAGPAFTSLGRLRLDAANNRILVSDVVTLLAVDLATGDRAIISDNSGSFGTGPNFQQIRGVDIDSANNRLLVADQTINAILAVDPVTGDRTIFSNTTNGTGTDFSNLRDVVIDAPSGRALVSDITLDAIFAVDLATGNRTVISQFSTGTGTGPDMGRPTHLALDHAGQRLLIAAYEQFGVYAMDLLTGNRTLISGNSSHVGPEFVRIRGVVLQAGERRALVVDTNGRSLLSVNLAPVIGERTYLSRGSAGVGAGTDFGTGVYDVAVDAANNRAFVTDIDADAVWSVDLESGDRTILADATTGTGPALNNPATLALDEATGTLYVGGLGNVLYAVDSTSGDKTIISDSTTGTGPWGNAHEDIALDKANSRVLMIEGFSDRILAIDLATGNRTILSDNVSAGTGPLFVRPVGIVMDADNNRALATDYEGASGRLFAVDLTTGDRTILSDNTTGSGLQLGVVQYLALDERNNRVYVSNNNDSFYTIDLATGDRDQFYNSGGPGPEFGNSRGLAYDVAHGRLLVADEGLDAVLTLDIYDPVFGINFPATPFSSTPSVSYSLASGGAGASYAEWDVTGTTVTGPVTLTFGNMPVELIAAPVGEVIDFTFTYTDISGNLLKATPLISGPAYTLVNAITATVTPSADTIDATQGSLFFEDGIGDAIASDILIELDNNATLNSLAEGELAIRLRGDFTGISRVAANIESGVFRAATPTNGNFTLLDPGSVLIGGTNDVTATWDGTLNTSETDTNFNATIQSASSEPFFGNPWTAHHIRFFGPGSYSFDSDCTSADLDAGNNTCGGSGPLTTLTIGAGQIGAHML